MNSRRLVFLFLFLIIGCVFYFYKNKPLSYFEIIKIEEFTKAKTPCIQLQIDGLNLNLELDSGYDGNVSLDSQVLDLIPKTFLKEKVSCGITGKLYRKNVYTVSKVQIGSKTFISLPIEENSVALYQDAHLLQDASAIHKDKKTGKIGWGLFPSSNLLIDIPNLKIGMCDSITTLQSKGYFKNKFVAVPLLQQKSYIGIAIQSSLGPLQCCIDTGATISVLNAEKEGDDFQQELIQIGGENFGSLDVYPMPIKIPQTPDLILGMNFLSKHTVFIDFKRQMVYISIS